MLSNIFYCILFFILLIILCFVVRRLATFKFNRQKVNLLFKTMLGNLLFIVSLGLLLAAHFYFMDLSWSDRHMILSAVISVILLELFGYLTCKFYKSMYKFRKIREYVISIECINKDLLFMATLVCLIIVFFYDTEFIAVEIGYLCGKIFDYLKKNKKTEVLQNTIIPILFILAGFWIQNFSIRTMIIGVLFLAIIIFVYITRSCGYIKKEV